MKRHSRTRCGNSLSSTHVKLQTRQRKCGQIKNEKNRGTERLWRKTNLHGQMESLKPFWFFFFSSWPSQNAIGSESGASRERSMREEVKYLLTKKRERSVSFGIGGCVESRATREGRKKEGGCYTSLAKMKRLKCLTQMIIKNKS